MNELIKKGLKNWTKIKLNNLKYYHELLKEEMGRFKYPLHGIKKYTINIFKLNRIKKLLKYSNKLHIGCGGVKINGFINIDAFKTPATDFICEIENLPKYIRPNSISMIYSSHTLEHFARREAIEVLKMFYDFLQPGGELRISVPDLIKLADLAKTKSKFKDMELIQGVLMGGQDTRYNYHKSIFWFDLLKQILLDIGFKDISEYPSYPHFLGDIKDGSSLAGKLELGVYISLNVKATK
jgi:predicted SAM-dependent methyltransferase